MAGTVEEITVQEALHWARGLLGERVEAGAFEAEVLLRHVLGCSRADLFSNFERKLEPAERGKFRELVERRFRREPLQYLTGSQAFRGLELLVGPGVLIPRPETELVVERALELIEPLTAPKVVELGTGSGAIALSIASERGDSRVWATEISPEAIAWARKNLEVAGIENVVLCEGDLFALPNKLRGEIDLVVANPPYLSEAELDRAPAEVRDHEPRAATLSGLTGLEVPARVVEQSLEWLKPGGWMVMEISPEQAGRLQSLLEARYREVQVQFDLAGKRRVAVGRKPLANESITPSSSAQR
jgi:release factor glutamine methyltransferase